MQAFYSRNCDFDNVTTVIRLFSSLRKIRGLRPRFAQKSEGRLSCCSSIENVRMKRAGTDAKVTPRGATRGRSFRGVSFLEDEFQTQLNRAIATGAENRVHRGHVGRLASAPKLTRYRWV